MLKFIWNSWWRNKERFILLLVGVLILSTGLSYLVGITQANNGTVVDELQKRWKASYHLVVRPPGSRSVTEDLDLLEPNYLSGLEGGITLEQYEKIKAMADVEIAAPIAMMGSIRTSMRLDEVALTEPGIYRLNTSQKTNTGAGIETFEGNSYYTVGKWQPAGLGKEYGASPLMRPLNLSFGTHVMIAGIDPEAESALVGIDQALIPSENSRFFSTEDAPQRKEDAIIQIPAIVSSHDYVDANMTYTIEKLDIPFADSEQPKIMEEIKEKGAEKYLEKQEGTEVETFTYTTEDVHDNLIESILDPGSSSASEFGQSFDWMADKPSPVNYKPVTSPFGNRWPYSYEVQPYSVPEDSLLAVKHMYRPVNMFSETSVNWPKLDLDYIGVFDPQKLDISKDPLTELPMETYFPAKAQWVVDSQNQPVNPPADMKPLNNPYGFLTKPPLILTTIEAAAEVLGEKPISAIRVNVSGVESLNAESEVKLQAVAKEIEDTTGLITDVTLGSSPQLALTHLPGLEGEDGIGWVQQPWIKLGSSISIFQETKVGMSGVIASVILVAIVYVFTSSIIMLYARKKEFAVLLSIGWRPSQLSKLLFLESTLLGVVVALVSWLILGAFMVSGNIEPSLTRVLLIGISGLAIYWLGSLIPIWLIRGIKPYESMRSGEISKRRIRPFRSESTFGMSVNNLFAQWKRSLLSILAIAVPTSLFIFFLFVTFRLKGVLYATWLGEFVALEVGTMHYVAMAVALLIAVLTTTEIMWQNISERQAQIAVLKATGWRNHGIRLMVLLEGVATGLLAGLLGLAIAIAIIFRLYGQFPFEEFGFLAFMLLIPVATGILGALLPAEKAVRILPYGAINGTLQNSKKVEKQFKWAIGVAGTALITGVLALLLFAIPESDGPSTAASGGSSEQKTSGTLLASEPIEEEKDTTKKPAEEPVAAKASAITELQEKAYRSFKLGEMPDKKLELKFSEQVAPPDNLAAKEGYRLLSIPVTLDTLNVDEFYHGGSITYKPHGIKLVDDEGEEYSIVNMDITEKGTWDGKYKYIQPGKTTTVLTYEVPNTLSRVALVAHGDFLPDIVVVEIPLEKTASASGIFPGSSAAYNIDISLDNQDFFDIRAEINVRNESGEPWQDLGFYFVPNALTADNKPDILSEAGESKINSITIAGKEIPYGLEGNRLLLELEEPLAPEGTSTVVIDYRLKLPNNGIRLAQAGNNFHLAQWYPMLAHFDGGWKIEDFDIKGESYHTNYGTYQINYSLPDDFLTVSSAVDGEILPASSGTLKGENIKDFYLAFLDPADWTSMISEANGTSFRTFLPSDGPDFTQQMTDSAKEAFSFFEERLGGHPVAELDMIGNNGNMEYPNVIEVNNNETEFEHTLVHEIAHQWFYHLISNNPYRDAWLDESLAEWATAMYLAEKGDAEAFGFSEGISNANPTTEFVNLPLDEFEKGEYYATVYGKAPLLLNDFFQETDGQEQAFNFLAAYVAKYQNKYVDSEEFAAFFEEQIEGDNQEFLASWLDLENEE